MQKMCKYFRLQDSFGYSINSLCTLQLHSCLEKVTVGDSGVCCCLYDVFRALINPLLPWICPCQYLHWRSTCFTSCLSVSGRSQIGFLFTMMSTKRLDPDVLILFNRFFLFLPHILALFIGSDTDCSTQNESTHGCFKTTSQVDCYQSGRKIERCVYMFRLMVLLRFGSPYNCFIFYFSVYKKCT